VVLPACTLQMMRGRSRRLLPRCGSAATSGRCETVFFFLESVLLNFPYTGGYDKTKVCPDRLGTPVTSEHKSVSRPQAFEAGLRAKFNAPPPLLPPSQPLPLAEPATSAAPSLLDEWQPDEVKTTLLSLHGMKSDQLRLTSLLWFPLLLLVVLRRS
jgi:hypothetical protein